MPDPPPNGGTGMQRTEVVIRMRLGSEAEALNVMTEIIPAITYAMRGCRTDQDKWFYDRGDHVVEAKTEEVVASYDLTVGDVT